MEEKEDVFWGRPSFLAIELAALRGGGCSIMGRVHRRDLSPLNLGFHCLDPTTLVLPDIPTLASKLQVPFTASLMPPGL